MSDSFVSVRVDGPVVIVTMDDASRRNAVNLEMRHQIVDALLQAQNSEECRSIVLTGAGGNFSAGGDLSSMNADRRASQSRLQAMADVVRSIVECPKPVIAAVDGHAYGAGLSFASACDILVASQTARFCCSFGRMGLTADSGLHWSLPARVGLGSARMLIMLGRVIDAKAAHGLGLVDELCAGDSLDTAHSMALELAARAPLAIAATKQIFRADLGGLDAVLAQETSAQQRLMATADFAEGRSAFFEKRSPVFVGG